jgi:hypothetical protein
MLAVPTLIAYPPLAVLTLSLASLASLRVPFTAGVTAAALVPTAASASVLAFTAAVAAATTVTAGAPTLPPAGPLSMLATPRTLLLIWRALSTRRLVCYAVR